MMATSDEGGLMATAGFCSECNANTWLNEDGSCVSGHPAHCVSGVYETGAPAPAAMVPKKSKVGLIVVVVIAVLALFSCLVAGIVAAISVPVFNSAQGSARQKACFANQRMIEGSVEQYLAADPNNTRTSVAGSVVSGNPLLDAATGYLKEAPKCPLGDKPYVYDADTRATICPYGDPPAGHGHY
jgi:hypothetical protein